MIYRNRGCRSALGFVELFCRRGRYSFSADLTYEIEVNDRNLVTDDETG